MKTCFFITAASLGNLRIYRSNHFNVTFQRIKILFTRIGCISNCTIHFDAILFGLLYKRYKIFAIANLSRCYGCCNNNTFRCHSYMGLVSKESLPRTLTTISGIFVSADSTFILHIFKAFL